MKPRQITFGDRPTANEYSSVSPWNCSNTRLLLLASTPTAVLDHFQLYGGAQVENLPLGASTRPRWSRTDPNRLTYLEGNKLKIYDTETGYVYIRHTFSEYEVIDDGGETDISADGNHRILFGAKSDGSIEVFIHNLQSNSKELVFPQYDTFDGLKITGDNFAVVSRASGIYLLDSQPTRRLTTVNGHAATAIYQDRDVLLWCSANDPHINKNAVIAIDIETAVRRVLFTLDWAYAFHISACDRDFCLVSCYAPDGSLPCQLWRVPLDGSPATRLLADTGGIIRDYTSQPRAALSRDGSRCVYSVDDGSTVNTWLLLLDEVPKPAETLTDVNFKGSHGKWHVAFDIDVINDVPMVSNFRMQDRH